MARIPTRVPGARRPSISTCLQATFDRLAEGLPSETVNRIVQDPNLRYVRPRLSAGTASY